MDIAIFWSLATATTLADTAVIYHHAIYPFILKRAAKSAATRARNRPLFDSSCAPIIEIIVPVCNEADRIRDKIVNLASLDYPTDRLSIIIACDGCTDETAMIASATVSGIGAESRIKVLTFMENRGKVAVLNDVISRSRADIVALSDTSALLDEKSLELGAAHFSDPAVGVVAATYQISNPGGPGEAAYWKYQVSIKEGEAALGAPLGAHGAFYLIRRKAFEILPTDTINDDFIIPMMIVARGYRALYDRQIVAIETEVASSTEDLRRRRRIAAGNAQQLIRLARLLHPRYGGLAFAFFSGKCLRVFMPFLLILSFSGSALLAIESSIFALSAGMQCIGYVAAASFWGFPQGRAPKFISILKYVLSGHAACLLGVIRYALGLDKGPWKRVVKI